MSLRSTRYRLNESNNIWPGFVDVLATLLIVIIFVLMIFTVSQIYLSDAISGKDKALQDLRNQINQLSKMLVIETEVKESTLQSLLESQESLEKTTTDLQNQEIFSKDLQADLADGKSKLLVRDKNILVLSEQIKELLNELRIVASALDMYEGSDIVSFKTDGLGERINKALTVRIDQLNQLNKDLDEGNILLAKSENNLKDKIKELKNLNNNLTAINESLGLEDANLLDQLNAIQKKNEQIKISEKETQLALATIDQFNQELILKDKTLQEQILQYQEITNDLLAINDSLGLKDASLVDQLEAIRVKNKELTNLNLNLVEKDNTIFSLRGKILELNDILSLNEERQAIKQNQIVNLNKNLNLLEIEKLSSEEKSKKSIKQMELRSTETFKQVELLSNEIDSLKEEINLLNTALDANEQSISAKELKIELLGERLNKALTSKVFELQKYRSEFFGKLKSILGNNEGIRIVGDRFIFESELLFNSGSANLQLVGREKLKQIGITLMDTTNEIPSNIDWIIQVEGHTDNRPIKTIDYPSNWELSTARANSVLKLLLDLGFSPNRLSAAGYGEFYPINKGKTAKDLQQNRRIELKLTSR